jgi:hypothetical protein
MPRAAAAVLFACLALTIPAFANDTTLNVNVNPPRQLAGYDAVPIRMESEHITLHFGKQESKVDVEFTFVNQQREPIYCWAGFPDEDLVKRWLFYGPKDAQGNLPDYTFGGEELFGDYAGSGLDGGALRDFKSWTRFASEAVKASQPLETKLVRIERIAYEPGAVASLGTDWPRREDTALNELMFCHVFPLNLNPLEPVVIGHGYTTLTGTNVEQQHLLSYTLGTGRSWAGTIGTATIDVYLEDGIKYEDLNFENAPDTYGAVSSPDRTQWKKLGPQHLQIVWSDFEPEGEQGYLLLATKPLGLKHD